MRSERAGMILKKGLLAAAILFVMLLMVEMLATYMGEKDATWKPDYEMKELENIAGIGQIGNGNGTEYLETDAYTLIFEQTGLGKSAVNRLMQAASGSDELLEWLSDYQADFFKESHSSCEKIGLVTYEERFRARNRNYAAQFDFADIKDGDILIGNNTHSFGWRHGHAAIVVDASEMKTLEAVLWGEPSKIQTLTKWRSYPRVAVLRLSESAANQMEYSQAEAGMLAAAYALEHGVGVEYRLLSGFLEKAPAEMSSTQCAHLVWSAYESLGIDIDSDGGWLVTPYDIINSGCIEVVQVYGMNPQEPWV